VLPNRTSAVETMCIACSGRGVAYIIVLASAEVLLLYTYTYMWSYRVGMRFYSLFWGSLHYFLSLMHTAWNTSTEWFVDWVEIMFLEFWALFTRASFARRKMYDTSSILIFSEWCVIWLLVLYDFTPTKSLMFYNNKLFEYSFPLGTYANIYTFLYYS